MEGRVPTYCLLVMREFQFWYKRGRRPNIRKDYLASYTWEIFLCGPLCDAGSRTSTSVSSHHWLLWYQISSHVVWSPFFSLSLSCVVSLSFSLFFLSLSLTTFSLSCVHHFPLSLLLKYYPFVCIENVVFVHFFIELGSLGYKKVIYQNNGLYEISRTMAFMKITVWLSWKLKKVFLSSNFWGFFAETANISRTITGIEKS